VVSNFKNFYTSRHQVRMNVVDMAIIRTTTTTLT